MNIYSSSQSKMNAFSFVLLRVGQSHTQWQKPDLMASEGKEFHHIPCDEVDALMRSIGVL